MNKRMNISYDRRQAHVRSSSRREHTNSSKRNWYAHI